ncbi:helix-turn-helix domain-containing protein [Pseudoflavonifractor phocaeensis]|uniref:helix-turn-helix domain-containing protein n=1 Tax=Pseudoflavonifractor phocaeensis TaxID=1870988 RepID=UPI001959ADF5|nr:helix-turn-helix transcriptional regulator [Pseudoflavonifractor phocaeensis]
MRDTSIEIGRRIKAARKAAKMSQTDLANRINKTLRTVQKYESGEIVPSIDMIGQIAEVLGVLPFQLIAYERQELRIKSLSDIFYILNELNNKTGIRFEIETKRTSKDGKWSCALKFDGNDPANPYNADLCKFLEQYALQRHRLESYWTTKEAFDSWLDESLSYYATEVLQDREHEELPYAERIKRRNELEQQRLEARKKAALADSDASEK